MVGTSSVNAPHINGCYDSDHRSQWSPTEGVCTLLQHIRTSRITHESNGKQSILDGMNHVFPFVCKGVVHS